MKGSHFVLVHGACDGAWCWYKLATLLEQAGHQVSTPDLAASGVDTKQTDDLKSISEYSQPLMDLMASLPSEEKVILVGHSFGGVVITLAMERFPEKISIAVFLAAFMCGPDLSLVPFVHEYFRGLDSLKDMIKFFFSNGTESPPTSMILGMELLATMMYQLCPPEVLTLAFTLVRPFFLLSDDAISADVAISKEKYGSAIEVDCDRTDEVVWTAGPNGTYSMKHTYEVLRPRASPFPCAKVIWYKGNIPRHSFITWLAAHSSLKTMSKLKKWGKAQSDLCVLCLQEAETENHLFFACMYSKSVWTQVLQYVCYYRQVLQWNQELEWCVQHFVGNEPGSVIKKLALNATVYHLWTERNRRVYDNKRQLGAQVVQRVYDDVRINLAGLKLKVEDRPSNREVFNQWNIDPTYFIKAPIKCACTRPLTGWFKLNSDGSFQGTRGGYGAIIRDTQGQVVMACTGSTSGHSVIKHELQGVEAGLRIADLNAIQRLELSTDSHSVFGYLTKSMQVPWDLRHIVGRIRRQLIKLEEFKILHHYR